MYHLLKNAEFPRPAMFSFDRALVSPHRFSIKRKDFVHLMFSVSLIEQFPEPATLVIIRPNALRIIGFHPAFLASARSPRHNICVTEPLYSGVDWQDSLDYNEGASRRRATGRTSRLFIYLLSNRIEAAWPGGVVSSPIVALVTTTKAAAEHRCRWRRESERLPCRNFHCT